MTIDGVAATTEATFDVVNPATGAPEAMASDCTPQQLDAAMDSAAKAYRSWRSDEGRRHELLRQCADALMAAAEDVAPILTLEQGKPLGEATFEVYGAAIWFSYYADPRQVIHDDDAAYVEVVQRPLGVVARHHPVELPARPRVLEDRPRPARRQPDGAQALAVHAPGHAQGRRDPPRRASARVLNVISGKDPLEAPMTSHPVPRKISFNGSVATGKKVAAAAAPNLKRTTLELGGNDPAIVLDDVDVDAVVEKLFWGAFQNNGPGVLGHQAGVRARGAPRPHRGRPRRTGPAP